MAVLFLAVSNCGLYPQNLNKVLPKGAEAGEPLTSLAPLSDTGSKSSGSLVIVPKLKGIIFVAGPQEIKSSGAPSIEGIQSPGLPLLSLPDFLEKMNGYLGSPLTLDKLNQITREVIRHYQANDRPVVDAIIPEQDVDNGVLQVAVIEGKVHLVKVRGNKWFRDEVLLGELGIRQGDSISEKETLEALNAMNQNPFREINAEFMRGPEPGSTDIILRTKDRFPVRTYSGYDNTGNAATGYDRWHNGVNWGNAFGLDQQLNYQLTTDNTYNRFIAHAASYIIPMPLHHTWTIYGGYISTQARNPAGDDTRLHGYGWQVSSRYQIPLPTLGAYSQSYTAGYDFKETNNNLDFGGLNVFNGATDVSQFSHGYDGRLNDAYGSTEVELTLYLSPGGFTGLNRTSSFDSTRSGAHSNYTYGVASISRLTNLPADFSWLLKGTYQGASSNLLPSEQFGIGGNDSVRGYQEHVANGDQGWLLNNELRSPPLNVSSWFAPHFGQSFAPDKLQLLAFMDYGWVRNNNLLAGEAPNTYLLGAGPGFRFTFGQTISIRADYGFQLTNPNLGDPDNSRGHLSINVSF